MLIGIAFVVAGLFVHRAITPDSGDTVVEGVVVDVVVTGSGDSRSYSPVVQYMDPASGLSYAVEGTINSSSEPTIGDSRDVAFPPGDPADGKVVGQVWFAWIFIVVGLLTIAMMALLSRTGRRRHATVEPDPGPQDAVRREQTFRGREGPQDKLRTDDTPQDEVRD